MFQQKATIRLVMFVRPSVWNNWASTGGGGWGDFHVILFLSIFTNPVDRIPISVKSDKNNGYFI